MDDDDLFLPVADECVVYGCGLAAEAHVGWEAGGPRHLFTAAEPGPRPERIASSFITTEWTCTHCGAACDVWGVADVEWMECSSCGGLSFLLAFMNEQNHDD